MSDEVEIRVTRRSEDENGTELVQVRNGNLFGFVVGCVPWEDLRNLFGDCVKDMRSGETRELTVRLR